MRHSHILSTLSKPTCHSSGGKRTGSKILFMNNPQWTALKSCVSDVNHMFWCNCLHVKLFHMLVDIFYSWPAVVLLVWKCWPCSCRLFWNCRSSGPDSQVLRTVVKWFSNIIQDVTCTKFDNHLYKLKLAQFSRTSYNLYDILYTL